ncbi:MAG TPA: hypothetical protein VFJ96_12960 [Gemmatimonadaceae bacterium]|nr:hypothetical protein [Gemmatimonadaceae bacterium]
MDSEPATPRRRALLALLAGIAAFCIVWIATAPPGLGLDPDSASYLNAAESLVRHGELRAPTFYDWVSPDSTEPLAHFPPGMPTALAIPRALGASQSTAARLVVASAAFVTASATLLIVANAVGLLAGVLAVLLLFATPAVLETHLSILSEPLFYALLVVTLALMVRAPDRPLRYGLTAAAGSLVRYAGVSLVGAAVLWAFARGADLRDRIRRASIAALPAIVGYGAWLVRTKYETGGGVRDVSVYHGFMATVREGATTIAAWLAPSLDAGLARTLIALVVLALLITLVVLAARRLAQHAAAAAPDIALPPHRLLAATLLLAGVYVTVVVLSRGFADGAIPFDNRILSPLFLLLEISAVVSLAVWWRAPRAQALRVVAAAALLVWWGASLATSWNDVSYAMENGSDYGEARWRSSPLVAWTRTDGARCAIFTNQPAAIYFQAHRLPHGTPLDQSPDTLRAFADTLVARRGALVAFDEPGTAAAIPPDSVLRALSLERIARFADGSIWMPASAAPTALGNPMDGVTSGHARCGESSDFTRRR